MVFNYMIVSEEESNLKENKLSVQSPIGKGLLGKKVGETTNVDVPSGNIKFEILDISL
jgi:transcription elongation factor GreA